MWSTFVLAVLAALIYAAVITWGMGRRRPGLASATLSAVNVFLILVFVIWAIASWIGPRGPIVWSAPWLLIAIVGAIVALIVIATATEHRAERGELGSGDAAEAGRIPSIAMGLGFGSVFWLMIVGLAIAAVAGIAATHPKSEQVLDER